MTQILDFGTELDAVQRMLEEVGELSLQTSETVESASGAAGKVAAEVVSVSSAIEAAGSSVVEATSAITDACSVTTGIVTNRARAIAGDGASLVETVLGYESLATAGHQQLEAEQQRFQSAVLDTRSQLRAEIDNTMAATARIEAEVLETRERTEALIADVRAAIADFAASLIELGERTVASFEELGVTLREEIESRFTELFEDVRSQLEEHLITQTEEGFETARQELLDAINEYRHVGERLSELLEQRLRSTFDIADEATELVEQRLEQEIRELVEMVIAKILHEVMQSMMMATAGSTTTAGLGPAVPALVAAKAVTGSIQEAIDFMKSMGF